jgi:hypothetical protein
MAEQPQGPPSALEEPLDFNVLAPPPRRGAPMPWGAIGGMAAAGFVVGLVGGYFLSVYLGLMLWPDSNLAPLPFLFTLWPAMMLGTPLVMLLLLWVACLLRRLASGHA